MIIVRVPRWAATSEQFTIPVEVEQNMPAAAKTHPIELNISGFELIWAAVLSGRPAQFLQNPAAQAMQSLHNGGQPRAYGSSNPTNHICVVPRSFIRRSTRQRKDI